MKTAFIIAIVILSGLVLGLICVLVAAIAVVHKLQLTIHKSDEGRLMVTHRDLYERPLTKEQVKGMLK
jgi:hypothetical protein